MLKLAPPNYQFCPFCGRKLEIKQEGEKQRKFCQRCNWTYYPHVAAAVNAVIVRGNKVLLVRRGRKPYKDTWQFPGGFIDYGEHPEDALAREIKEETELELRKAKLMLILQTDDDPRSPGHFCIFYKVAVSGNRLSTDKDENQEIGWFDLDKPPKIGWKWHKHVMQSLQKSRS